MTKVQIRFELQRPLDNAGLVAISAANSVYGIQKIDVAPNLNAITVTYDASRLQPAEVEAALTSCGIPVMNVHHV
jgi:hypothetical protein